MRLAFLGSPDFAVAVLDGVVAAGHDVVRVYCQMPRPGGRGQETRPCPVHRRADALGIPVATPRGLRRNPAEWASFAALGLDAAVVAAYGLILPPAMLDAPHLGCLNVHASLLPRWRGAAPIQAALLAGDAVSGVTIMRMDEGLDTGPMLSAGAVPLGARATAPWLHDELARIGTGLVVDALAARPEPVAQPETGACYAPKLSKADAPLDWNLPAAVLDRRVRALNPWPGATTRYGTETWRILAAMPEGRPGGTEPPGTVLDGALLVACGDGALRVTVLQRPGRAAMPAAAFLRGQAVPAGTRFG